MIVLLWRLVNSPFGRVLQAIRQNEARTAFLGYNVVLFNGPRFTLSCAVSPASPARCSRWRRAAPSSR